MSKIIYVTQILYQNRTICFKTGIISSVFRGGGACGHAPPPRKVRKHFLTRYTVRNGISNLYILLKSALKMQEMPFQTPKFQKSSGRHAPGPTYNCVVTMASRSLKSWLRHWTSSVCLTQRCILQLSPSACIK